MGSTYGTGQQLVAGISHRPGAGAVASQLRSGLRPVPELNGEIVITRYTLRELLDKLDELRP